MERTLLVGALLGFPILIKRFDEMRLQTRVSQENLKETQKQSRTSQYRDARDLLKSNQLNSRMMGIADLWRFANTHPQDEYHHVMDVFTQFVKYPVSYKWEEGTKEENQKAGKRPDISAILEHMGEEGMAGVEPYEINLRGANLEGADLSYANLEEAYLFRAHLAGANLREAKLARANLMEAKLVGANLMKADLTGANLMWADLDEALLKYAYLRGAFLGEAFLRGAHLEETNLKGLHLGGTYLGGANLEGANLAVANLEGANLEDAHLAGADLRLTIINKADFTDAKDLTQEQIRECVFITDDTRFKGKPQLPKGIKPNYRKLRLKEWEKERDKYLSPL